MRVLGVALAALLGVVGTVASQGSAEARMHHPARGHRIAPAAVAPLDGFATPAAAYSFRKLKSTYAGPAVRIRRASDNAELDIAFLGCTGFTGCPWDAAAATAHCAATSCFVKIMYDQSGNARDLAQATAASQPALIFNCDGTLPCARTTAATQALASAAYTPPSAMMSFSAVGNRRTGTGICYWLRTGSTANRLAAVNTVANTWQLTNGGGIETINGLATADGAWHAAQGVINGAASVLNVDDTETTGTVTGSVVAGALTFIGGTTTTCDLTEAMYWGAYALSPAERTVLTNNQRGFWGTP